MEAAKIESMIIHHLNRALPHHKMRDVYFYAVLPAGKFFRPSLVWSIAKDLNYSLFNLSIDNINSNLALLSSSVELHHAYTLIHDDLPCMDNDLVRRGKACTHIAYGEWQALLAGDGLLNVSYQLIAKMNHPRVQELLKLYSWATGPKGLIHGQSLDLSHEMTESFTNTIRTHELKTARLIQVSILGSALLAMPQSNRSVEKKLFAYARLLGINFQLIDDLSELASTKLSQHEIDVNPWLKFSAESLNTCIDNLKKFEALSVDLNLKSTNSIVNKYYEKMLGEIEPNVQRIHEHLKNKTDLAPVIFLMKNFCNIKNFN